MTRRRLILAVLTVAVLGGSAGPALADPKGADAVAKQICVGVAHDPDHRGSDAYCVTVW
jgi:hypothetical protein